jgi:hypothetical protein
MRLSEIRDGQAPAQPVTALGFQRELTKEIQTRLGDLGFLDPPADGKFGSVSQWALRAFAESAGMAAKTQIDKEAAAALLAAQPLPLAPGGDLAGRIVARMLALGHWVSRHPDCVNIVYLEGASADGVPNDNRPNVYNDSRFAIRIEGGVPKILGAWEATTEPGRAFTVDPSLANPLGAARIALGQHKAWILGFHKSNPRHPALVQRETLPVFRDLNRDFQRQGDTVHVGLFGINQHHGFSSNPNDIQQDSAGCLVGRAKTGHTEFLRIVKTDARFHASADYRFMTAILDGRAL